MNQRAQLLGAATAYSVLTGVALSRLSRTIMRDASFFSRLALGHGCTLRTYERFFSYFAQQGVPDPVAALAAQQRDLRAADCATTPILPASPDALLNLEFPSPSSRGRASEPGPAHQAPVPDAAERAPAAQITTANGRTARSTFVSPRTSAAPAAPTSSAEDLDATAIRNSVAVDLPPAPLAPAPAGSVTEAA